MEKQINDLVKEVNFLSVSNKDVVVFNFDREKLKIDEIMSMARGIKQSVKKQKIKMKFLFLVDGIDITLLKNEDVK